VPVRAHSFKARQPLQASHTIDELAIPGGLFLSPPPKSKSERFKPAASHHSRISDSASSSSPGLLSIIDGRYKQKQHASQHSSDQSGNKELPLPEQFSTIMGGAGTCSHPILLDTPQKRSVLFDSIATEELFSPPVRRLRIVRDEGVIERVIRRRMESGGKKIPSAALEDTVAVRERTLGDCAKRKKKILDQIMGHSNNAYDHFDEPLGPHHSLSQPPTPSFLARLLAKENGEHEPRPMLTATRSPCCTKASGTIPAAFRTEHRTTAERYQGERSWSTGNQVAHEAKASSAWLY